MRVASGLPASDKPKKQRTVRPRVFLSKAENKQVRRLRPLEKATAYALSVYVVIGMSLILWKKYDFETKELWRLGVATGFAIALSVAARFTDRFVVGLAAMACVYLVPWGKYFVFGIPLLILMGIVMFQISRQRQAIITDRIARGDYGVDPRTAARLAREAKNNPTATTDATGRSLAPKSKRYTPPKGPKK
jgi:hypothetical protein